MIESAPKVSKTNAVKSSTIQEKEPEKSFPIVELLTALVLETLAALSIIS